MLTQPNQCAEIQNARCKHETTEMYASAMPAFDINIPWSYCPHSFGDASAHASRDSMKRVEMTSNASREVFICLLEYALYARM